MELLRVALLGGALALDATTVGQFMVSRPLVAGALAGWLLGDPALGFTIGAVLELYLLVAFPTGGSRFPEGATATVVAVAVATGVGGPGQIPLGIAIGLIWGQIGGLTITAQRRINGHFVPQPGAAHVTPTRLVTAHLGAIVLDFGRAASVTLTGAILGRAIVPPLGAAWPLSTPDSLGLVLVGASVSAGILLRDLGGFRLRRVVFAFGLAVGLVGARLI